MNSQELRALQEAYSQVYELEEGDNYDKNRKRAAQRAAARNEARAKGQTGNVPGVGYVTPRKERETYTDAAGTERHKTGARMPQKEEVDLYDLILSHLLDEGYADTEQAAEAIMVNMSEDWRESIVEAQKPLPKNKMWRQMVDKPNRTGENLYSKNNLKMHSVIKAHDADPKGEAEKAKAKSKYTG